MKHIYLTITFFFTAFVAIAQIPPGYYNNATGTGYALKTQLKVIITNGHMDQGYNALDNEYPTSDADNNYYDTDAGAPNTVLDMYSENPTGADPYNYIFNNNQECGNYTTESDCYNKEHIFPQGFYSQQTPMRSDIHHVVPTDGRVNGFRSSFPFGVVGTNLVSQSNITNPTQNGSKLGNCISPGYSGTVFEPIDEFKGDIARMLLYFAVRYEDNWNDSGWDSPSTANNMLNGTSDQFYESWYIDLLLDWHNGDAVNQREIDRNNAAYNYQGNRNPFIDNPAYANMIWNSVPDTQNPTDPTNLAASNPTDNSIDLNWTASTDDVAVASYNVYIDGAFSYNTGNTNTSTTVAGLLQNTNYCFTVTAVDTSANESGLSNSSCEMTTNNGSTGGTQDLFFSEYVEGGGTNKALEIANYTGATINLSAYTLKLASNSNSFGSPYSFAVATLSSGDVYVVANSGLNTACQAAQDDVNNSITSFSGNDAIGLFKNDVLIDIIGIEADGGTFAQNVTLIRKPSIEFPTTTFDINEWNQEAQDDCSNLGIHAQTLSILEVEINEFKIYPNPVKGNLLNIEVKQNTRFEVYDILGKKILNGNVTPTNKEVSVSRLNKGVYILKLETSNGSISKKLIKG